MKDTEDVDTREMKGKDRLAHGYPADFHIAHDSEGHAYATVALRIEDIGIYENYRKVVPLATKAQKTLAA
jgi:hypothetical protein